MIYISFKKLLTIEWLEFRQIGCSFKVYNLVPHNSNFKIFYILNTSCVYEMSPSFKKMSTIINVWSNIQPLMSKNVSKKKLF